MEQQLGVHAPLSRAGARRETSRLIQVAIALLVIAGAMPVAWATPAYVQGGASGTLNGNTVSVVLPSAQVAGHLMVVVVGFASGTVSATSVSDTAGNTFALAIGPTRRSGAATQYIYYVKNTVAAGANTVAVTFSSMSVIWPTVKVVEYSGIDTVSPLDVTVGNTGSSTTSNSGNLTTTYANDLLVAANYVEHLSNTAGPNFTLRRNDFDDIVEDRIVTSTGTYSATAPIDVSGWWVMQMAAFKAADGQAPTAPTGLSATAVSSSQINLSWTASTDNVAVTGYRVERCQGASCSSFAQIATPTATTFNDTGLTGSTSYSYRVRAQDAVPNLSGYSGTASATTSSGSGAAGGVTYQYDSFGRLKQVTVVPQ